MKIKDFKELIEIPEGVDLVLDGQKITIKGKLGEVVKIYKMPRFVFAKEGKNLLITCNNYSVYDRRNLQTIKAHIKNMIQGANEGFVYQLKICASHFPMTVAVQGNKLSVKNLLGEKVPRVLDLKKNTKVEVKGDIIEVSGTDLELVSQQAGDIEQLTRITNRDRRIFQDGIYIINKAGRAV
ncbi:MAG: 50S ribosomal protein L6 [Candidatus Woesearchaeota archaeon]